MKDTDTPTLENNNVAVIEKLKSSESSWSYLKIAQPHQDGSNFEFIQLSEEEIEYAIYERQGLYFVLIDFFKSYEEASEYAKKIINRKSSLKSIFSAN